MPLWGSVDNAANSDIAATMQVNKATTSGNRTTLYGNTRIGQFFDDKAVGQFAVAVGEAQASPQIPHAGWNLRIEGSGLRAGRVTYECLVAGGSITGDGSDDTYFPDYVLTFRTQPSSNSAQTGNVTIKTVGTTANAAYTVIIELHKNGQYYSGGQFQDPAAFNYPPYGNLNT